MTATERALQAARDSLQSLSEQAALLAVRADAARDKADSAIELAKTEARASGAAAERERRREGEA